MKLSDVIRVITAPSDNYTLFRGQFKDADVTHCPCDGYESAYEHFKEGVMKEKKLTRKRGIVFFPISRMRTGGGVDGLRLGNYSNIIGGAVIGWVWYTKADLRKAGFDNLEAQMEELKESSEIIVQSKWRMA